MTVEHSNGHVVEAPGWWRLDLAGGIPGLDVFPFCGGCGQLVASGYMRGAGGRVGQLYLCEECASGLMARVAEVRGLEIVDPRTDVVMEVSPTDVTVTVMWSKSDDLHTTEVIVWPAGQLSASQEADIADEAVTRLCDWLNSFRDALEADRIVPPEVVGR